MKKRSHAVQYPPCDDSIVAQVYNMLLVDRHVDSKLLGNILESCLSLEDKMNFLSALLLQPPTDQQREWIEAFGLAWRWTDVLCRSKQSGDTVCCDVEEVESANDDVTIN